MFLVKMRERTQQHSDSDEQGSEEEDNMEYHPEDTDTCDESDEEGAGAVKLLVLKDSSPKMLRSFGAQYLMMSMVGQLLQMSSK